MALKKILAAALMSAAAIAAPAMAAGGHGGGGHGGGGHGGGYHGGGGHYGHGGHGHGYYYGYGYGAAFVAGALLSPWYYPYYASYPYYAAGYPYYASYPAYPAVADPAPAAYFEQAQAVQPIASDAANYWYYCNDTRAFYPYVQSCATPWQRVPPTPGPGAAPR